MRENQFTACLNVLSRTIKQQNTLGNSCSYEKTILMKGGGAKEKIRNRCVVMKEMTQHKEYSSNLKHFRRNTKLVLKQNYTSNTAK